MPVGLRTVTTFMGSNLTVHNIEINLSFNQYLEIYPTEVKVPFLKDICTSMSSVCDGGKNKTK